MREFEEYLLGTKELPLITPEQEYLSGFKFAIVVAASGKQQTVYQYNKTGEQREFSYEVNKKDARKINPPLPFIRWARPMDI